MSEELLVLMKGFQLDLKEHTSTINKLVTTVAVIEQKIPEQPCKDHEALEKRVESMENDSKEKDKRTVGWMAAALLAIATGAGNIIMGLMKQGASNG